MIKIPNITYLYISEDVTDNNIYMKSLTLPVTYVIYDTITNVHPRDSLKERLDQALIIRDFRHDLHNILNDA